MLKVKLLVHAGLRTAPQMRQVVSPAVLPVPDTARLPGHLAPIAGTAHHDQTSCGGVGYCLLWHYYLRIYNIYIV